MLAFLEYQGPKFVKRKLSDLSEIEAVTHCDDGISIVANYAGKPTTAFLKSSYTLANAKKKVEDDFNLDPWSYTMEFELEGKTLELNTDDDLDHCLRLWRSAQKRIGQKIPFNVRVLP